MWRQCGPAPWSPSSRRRRPNSWWRSPQPGPGSTTGTGGKDIYGGFGIPAYWIVEPSRDRPELTVFELRSGAYEQIAHVTGGEEYRAAVPFPVTVLPSQHVTAK